MFGDQSRSCLSILFGIQVGSTTDSAADCVFGSDVSVGVGESCSAGMVSYGMSPRKESAIGARLMSTWCSHKGSLVRTSQ